MLMKQIPLTFIRNNETIINDWGQVVQKGDDTEIETRGSLQPMSLGEKTRVLPEGLRTTDAKIYYTTTELFPTRNGDVTKDSLFADYVMIRNYKYNVYDVGDWTTNTSKLAHFKVILVRAERV